MAGWARNSRVGKTRMVPPPAMAFMIPPPAAAATSARSWRGDIGGRLWHGGEWARRGPRPRPGERRRISKGGPLVVDPVRVPVARGAVAEEGGGGPPHSHPAPA